MLIKTRLIKIGNSQGFRIPKTVLEQAGLTDEVTIEVQAESLIIRPANHPRQGWEAAARDMVQNGDDKVWGEASIGLTVWDENEWQW